MASPETFDIPIGKVVGRKGDTGNGIKSIALLSTSWLNKTYRITMTDETTFDFVVTDGNGITGATFDAQTNALTLTFSNGTSFTTPSLKGTKGDTGNGISRIEKTGTEGLVDTYTVTYTDGQTFTYTVTNGADGVSPEVTVTQISGGHTVEIEDADGVKTFDVLDGEVTEARLAEALATKADVIVDTASGAIASFSDGADSMPIKKLVAQIEPVQDLHGYENPWPAGGGKNLFHFTAGRDTYTWSDGFKFDTVNPDDDGVIFNGTPTGNRLFGVLGQTLLLKAGTYKLSTTSANVGATLRANDTVIDSSYGMGGNPFTLSEDTTITEIGFTVLSGTSFNNEFVGIQIEAGNTPTSWTPYKNICPISGHTGMTVARTNENMFDMSQLLLASGWSVDSDGVYSGPKGSLHASFNRNGFPVCPHFEENTVYTLIITGKIDDSFIRVGFRYTDDTVDYAAISATDFETKFVCSTVSKTVKCIYATYGSNTSTKAYISRLGLYKSSTILPKDYKDSHATTIPITWESEAGTVYGGTVTLNEDGSSDVVSNMAVGNLSDLTWYYNSTGDSASENHPYFYSSVVSGMKPVLANCVLENFPFFNQSRNILASGDIRASHVNATQAIIAIRNDSITTLADFTTSLAGMKFAYETTEAQTYHFDNIGQLQTFLGTNNIWADTGDTAVEYCADTKLYIDRKIAEALGG